MIFPNFSKYLFWFFFFCISRLTAFNFFKCFAMTESAEPENEANENEARIQEIAVQVMTAMQDEHDKVLKQIKKIAGKTSGWKIFTAEVDGWTPFHAAVLRGSRKTLKLMLSAGVDVNVRMGQPTGLPGHCTALHIAAHRGDTKIIEYLLSRGAYINLKDSDDHPPLYYAASANHMAAVKILLKYGAEVQSSGVNLCDKDLNPIPKLLREFSLVGCSEQPL